MKLSKICLSLSLVSIILVGCSSPSSRSGGMEQELNIGGAPYRGTFANNDGNDTGDITLSLIQSVVLDASLLTIPVSGLVTFDSSVCLLSGEASGVLEGNSLSLRVSQGEASEIVMVFQATQNTLTGNYTVSGDTCSNKTGTGTINATR